MESIENLSLKKIDITGCTNDSSRLLNEVNQLFKEQFEKYCRYIG